MAHEPRLTEQPEESWWYDELDGTVKDENRLTVAIVCPAIHDGPDAEEARASRAQAGRMLAAAPALESALDTLAMILEQRLEADRLDGIEAPARDAQALAAAQDALREAAGPGGKFGWREGDFTIE